MPISGGSAFPGEVHSYNTPLGASETYTSPTFDVSQFSTITTYTDADVDGTINMEFSSDGTNWDRNKAVDLDVTISSGSVHTLGS